MEAHGGNPNTDCKLRLLLVSGRSPSSVDRGGSPLRLRGAQHLSGPAAGERVPEHLEPRAEPHWRSWHLHPAGRVDRSHAKPGGPIAAALKAGGPQALRAIQLTELALMVHSRHALGATSASSLGCRAMARQETCLPGHRH